VSRGGSAASKKKTRRNRKRETEQLGKREPKEESTVREEDTISGSGRTVHVWANLKELRIRQKIR